jgi:hypothetical protein
LLFEGDTLCRPPFLMPFCFFGQKYSGMYAAVHPRIFLSCKNQNCKQKNELADVVLRICLRLRNALNPFQKYKPLSQGLVELPSTKIPNQSLRLLLIRVHLWMLCGKGELCDASAEADSATKKKTWCLASETDFS